MTTLATRRSRGSRANPTPKEITISDLYPQLNSAEQADASLHLREYIDVICEIYERKRALTGLDQPATI